MEKSAPFMLFSVLAALSGLQSASADSTALTCQRKLTSKLTSTQDSTGRESVSFAELTANAAAQYHGDGLCIRASREGAILRCVFQKLEAAATPEGLWLLSTSEA